MKTTVTLLILLFFTSFRTVSYGASDSKLHLDLFNDGEFIVFVDNIRYQSVRGGIDISGLNPGTHGIRITEIFRGNVHHSKGRSVLYNGSINIPFRSAVFAKLTPNYQLRITEIKAIPVAQYPSHRGYNSNPRNNSAPQRGNSGYGRSGGGQTSNYSSNRDFTATMDWMERARNDRDKLIIAQNFANRGIRSNEVAILMNQLTFEKNKLSFAKYAYAYTIDKRNYEVVYRSLTFDSSVRELERYIIRFR